MQPKSTHPTVIFGRLVLAAAVAIWIFALLGYGTAPSRGVVVEQTVTPQSVPEPVQPPTKPPDSPARPAQPPTSTPEPASPRPGATGADSEPTVGPAPSRPGTAKVAPDDQIENRLPAERRSSNTPQETSPPRSIPSNPKPSLKPYALSLAVVLVDMTATTGATPVSGCEAGFSPVTNVNQSPDGPHLYLRIRRTATMVSICGEVTAKSFGRVSLQLNERDLSSSLTGGPTALALYRNDPLPLGLNTLVLVLYDRAGNAGRANVEFQVQ